MAIDDSLKDGKVDIEVQIGCYELLLELMQLKSKNEEEKKIINYLSKNLDLLLKSAKGEYKLDKDFYLLNAHLNYLESSNKEILIGCFDFLSRRAGQEKQEEIETQKESTKKTVDTLQPNIMDEEEVLDIDYLGDASTDPIDEVMPIEAKQLSIDHLDLDSLVIEEEPSEENIRKNLIQELITLMYPNGLQNIHMDDIIGQLNSCTLEQLQDLKKEYTEPDLTRS